MELFAHLAAVARLKKSRLKPPDKVPKAYNHRTFTLDGKMELDIAYQGMTMKTPIYIKLNAPEQLLLKEGVCRQLSIVTYHPIVSNRKRKESLQAGEQVAQLVDIGQARDKGKRSTNARSLGSTTASVPETRPGKEEGGFTTALSAEKRHGKGVPTDWKSGGNVPADTAVKPELSTYMSAMEIELANKSPGEHLQSANT